MRKSCTASAPAELIKLEPSRYFRLWWLGLHGLVLLALLMASALAAAAALPALILHAWRLRPVEVGLIVVSGDRFALPAEGRCNLRLSPRSAAGPLAIALRFSDRPGAPRLVFRDQLDRAAWRRLRLAVGGRP